MTDFVKKGDGTVVSAERHYQDRTADAQERIAAALERIAEALTVTETAPECAHPLEARTDTSTMGHPRWVCDPKKGGCGFTVGED